MKPAVALALVFSALPALASTPVTGTIDVDTAWKIAGSPFVINHELRISGGATLTIDPGVRVEFASGSYLVVGDRNGGAATLVARGTADEPVVFTSASATPARGDWSTVSFGPNAVAGTADPETGAWLSGSALEHCRFEYGGGDFFDGSGPSVVDFARLDPYGMVELIERAPVMNHCLWRWAEERGLYAAMEFAPVTVEIRDSVFESNGPDPEQGYGGGAELAGMVAGLVERCTFRDNRLEIDLRFGAGLSVLNSANLVVRDCLFEGNDAERFDGGIGGGMNLYLCADVTIEDCVFTGNDASIGGAIGDYYSDRVTLRRSRFEENLTMSDTVAGSGDGWLIEDCEFLGNAADAAAGALGLRGANGTVRRCTFRGNTARHGAGAFIWFDTRFEDNLVEDNVAEQIGGGVYLSDSGGWPGPYGMICERNVIRRNEAGWVGGGFFISRDVSTLIENEITDNVALQRGGGIYIDEPYDEPSMTIVLAGDAASHNVIARNQAPEGAAIWNDLASTSAWVDATGVCWGTMDPSDVEARVWHQTDDGALGVVDFSSMIDCGVTLPVPGGTPEVVASTFALAAPRPGSRGAGSASFTVTVDGAATVRLELFDVSGRRIAARPEVRLGSAGSHEVAWSPGVPAGHYFVRALMDHGRAAIARWVVLD